MVTDEEIDNPENPTQFWNAPEPIVVTDNGIIRGPVSPVQPANALLPIVVTDDGIVSVPVSPVQLTNALLLMVFTLVGITGNAPDLETIPVIVVRVLSEKLNGLILAVVVVVGAIKTVILLVQPKNTLLAKLVEL